MKTAVVTGASTGIGREIAKGLAALGHHVIMISKDPARAAAAADQVRAVATGGATVSSVPADLSLLSDVRRAAAEVKRITTRLDVLINNAAVVPAARTQTSEGLELAFATNVLAPLVLVQELKSLLEASAPARVINFFGGNSTKLDFDDLQNQRGRYVGFDAYSHTKNCVALLSIEMARRLVAANVTVNCVWPGIVNTEGMRAMPGMMGVLMFLMRPMMRKPEDGALAPIWAATAPELERVSGKFYGAMRGDPRVEMTPPKVATDLEAAKRLYEACERLTVAKNVRPN